MRVVVCILARTCVFCLCSSYQRAYRCTCNSLFLLSTFITVCVWVCVCSCAPFRSSHIDPVDPTPAQSRPTDRHKQSQTAPGVVLSEARYYGPTRLGGPYTGRNTYTVIVHTLIHTQLHARILKFANWRDKSKKENRKYVAFSTMCCENDNKVLQK